jgi:flagellar L-ring protein FlgH
MTADAGRGWGWLVAAAVLVAVASVPVAARANGTAPGKAAEQAASDSYDEQFARYLREARAAQPTTGPDIGWMVGLAGDRRARHVNDLLTVHVVESISATGMADSSLDKESRARVGVPNLFGLENHAPGWLNPGNLVNAGSKTDFKGGGRTSRAGTLTATMTVRVAEVLPNGDLVLEGAREIDINGDRQIVVLSGVVRATDVSPGNAVLSTQVGQLRIRYFGRGLMRDNLQPGWLIRVLNKIF